ncbi:unnamed protein product [Thelazia callipaeda]|uniref:Glycerate kinase n=1 Tax=Thelazia callipaeda TaxID=103827 RepID=A0A0N5D4X1_THECL|nr:unnamed protein product [Thelazia callipaeda]
MNVPNQSSMHGLRDICVSAFKAAVEAVQPYQRVFDTLQLVNGCMKIGHRTYQVDHNIHLAAFGKAALGMVRGAENALNGHIVEGIASVPRGTLKKMSNLNLQTKFLEGATNNLPDDDACNNARLIEEMAKRLKTSNDIFLVLISGGGSALLPAPVSSISLDDKLKTIKELTSRGADIKQLNTVRKALSRLKGGKLAHIAHPAKCLRIISVIISDVIGDPLEYIASGPTVMKQVDELDPKMVLKELNAWHSISEKVRQAVERAEVVNLDQNMDIQNYIVSNNKLALFAAAETLKRCGYKCHIVSSNIAEDADIYGSLLAHILIEIMKGKKCIEVLQSVCLATSGSIIPSGVNKVRSLLTFADKIALLFGGECTVKIRGGGLGGRNQEIVLTALSKLLDHWDPCQKRTEFALLSAGTDGQDGPTDAAGAVLTSDDVRYILKMNAEITKKLIDASLNNSDSYHFWKDFNNGKSHIICGPSGTNVMDMQVLLLSNTV